MQELRSCWEHTPLPDAGSTAIVDLSEVTFVDEDGERLLSDMRSAGVGFVAADVETKDLLDNLKDSGQKALRRLVRAGNPKHPM